MEENQVKVWYDEESDILYLGFKKGVSHEVVEAGPDIMLELDEDGKILGIELWNAKKNGIIERILHAVKQPL